MGALVNGAFQLCMKTMMNQYYLILAFTRIQFNAKILNKDLSKVEKVFKLFIEGGLIKLRNNCFKEINHFQGITLFD